MLTVTDDGLKKRLRACYIDDETDNLEGFRLNFEDFWDIHLFQYPEDFLSSKTPLYPEYDLVVVDLALYGKRRGHPHRRILENMYWKSRSHTLSQYFPDPSRGLNLLWHLDQRFGHMALATLTAVPPWQLEPYCRMFSMFEKLLYLEKPINLSHPRIRERLETHVQRVQNKWLRQVRVVRN